MPTLSKPHLDSLVADGLLTASEHRGLTVYNYSETTVYRRLWTPETLACRGLILSHQGDLVARPWPKFFNLGEPGFEPHTLPAEVPEVSDKHDGSLIIVFFNPLTARWQAATRRSFDNTQTAFAQQWLDRHQPRWPTDHTYLFELVAPWNRVVLPYDKADMILLGRVHTATGQDCSYKEAARFALNNNLTPIRSRDTPLSDLNLADPAVRNAEGYVARFSSGLRIKLKYAEYLRLHKLLTGLSPQGIWESLSRGDDRPPPDTPDEFLAWWQQHRDAMTAAFTHLHARAHAIYASVPAHLSRKEKAELFKQHPDLAFALFCMLDNRDPTPALWRRCRPTHTTTYLKDTSP